MMLGAIIAGCVIIHQQANAKPWNYPPGFVSDFRENIDKIGGQDRQVQSRSGVAQPSQGNTKTEIENGWLFTCCIVFLNSSLRIEAFELLYYSQTQTQVQVPIPQSQKVPKNLTKS